MCACVSLASQIAFLPFCWGRGKKTTLDYVCVVPQFEVCVVPQFEVSEHARQNCSLPDCGY